MAPEARGAYEMIGVFLRDAEFALEQAHILLRGEEPGSDVERRVGRWLTSIDKTIRELEGPR